MHAPKGGLGGLVLVLLLSLVILRLFLVQPRPKDISEAEETTLAALTSAPRTPGSLAHAKARDLIVEKLKGLGLSAEIQNTTSLSTRWGVPYDVARVENIVARLKGRSAEGTVALIAHYDSVPNSPGAADDASGVIALLETAKSIAEGPTPKNNLVFLFSDAEEAGVLGSRAFAAEHPLFRDINLALNFDARGNSGPLALIDTSPGGGALVRHFGEALPGSVVSSLFPDVARFLGHETDLGPFLQAGVKGMNFAFADGVGHYHAPVDDVNHLDKRSLRQTIDHAIALGRHFGDTDLESLKLSELSYFDMPVFGLVMYPRSWVLPLAIFVLLGLLGTMAAAYRKRETTGKELALSTIASLVPLLITPLSIAALVWLLRAALPGFGAFRSDPLAPGFARVALSCFCLAICVLLFRLFRARLSPQSMALGGLGVIALFALVTAMVLPGGSYVFTIPLFAMLGAYHVVFGRSSTKKQTPVATLLFILGAAIALWITTPIPYLLFVALGLPGAAAPAALVVCIALLLMPVWERTGVLSSPKPAFFAAAAGLLLLLVSAWQNQFSTIRPRPECLAYVLDSETQQAQWISTDVRLSPRDQTLFASEIPANQRFFLPGQGTIRHAAEAPLVDLKKPELVLLDDQTNNKRRTLRFRLRSTRKAPFLLVSIDTQAVIVGATIDGKRIDEKTPFHATKDEPWGFTFQGPPPEGIEWSVDLNTDNGANKIAPLTVAVVDRSYELPRVAPANDPEQMPMPFRVANSTFVSALFRY